MKKGWSIYGYSYRPSNQRDSHFPKQISKVIKCFSHYLLAKVIFTWWKNPTYIAERTNKNTWNK